MLMTTLCIKMSTKTQKYSITYPLDVGRPTGYVGEYFRRRKKSEVSEVGILLNHGWIAVAVANRCLLLFSHVLVNSTKQTSSLHPVLRTVTTSTLNLLEEVESTFGERELGNTQVSIYGATVIACFGSTHEQWRWFR